MSDDRKPDFRIGMVSKEPFAYACANQTSFSIGRTLKCPLPGLTYELLQVYTEAMDVRPVITWLDVESPGGMEKGNMTGVYAMIDNGIVDTVAITWQKTEERELFFDFSYPMYQVDLFYLVKEREISGMETILDVFSPFSLHTWLLYFATIASLIIVLILTNVSTIYLNDNSGTTISGRAWEFFRYLIANSEGDVRQTSIAGNILFITGGIMTIIMLSLFSGALLTQLLMSKTKLPFNTADEMIALIEKGEYKMIYNLQTPSFWYYREIETSNSSYYMRLRAALAKNPYALVNTPEKAIELVNRGGYIMASVVDSPVFYAATPLCPIVRISLSDMPLQWAHFMFRKNSSSSLFRRFDEAVVSTQRLTDRIWSTYYGDIAEERRMNQCRESAASLSSLNLEDAIGFFALLLVGLGTAIVIFLAEILAQLKRSTTMQSQSGSIRQ